MHTEHHARIIDGAGSRGMSGSVHFTVIFITVVLVGCSYIRIFVRQNHHPLFVVSIIIKTASLIFVLCNNLFGIRR